ncbi:MAG: hypothetical protein AB7S26_19395 [Sandaracinaceae bacterium]
MTHARVLGSALALSVVAAAAVNLAGCSPPTGGMPRPDPTSPTYSDAGPSAAAEECNGADDNGDGNVDEGCPCTAGATQACFVGPAWMRDVGICTSGSQTCMASSSEFSHWGPCVGSGAPSSEIPDNCVDEDCNGDMPGCGEACAEIEVCGNGIDDDCNGFVDCLDVAAGCDCPGTDPCAADPSSCSCVEGCVPGTWRYCDEPLYCNWGRQDCAPDGSWGACTETSVPPACDGGYFDSWYDPDCCVSAGFCCQNFGHDPALDDDASVGNCAGVSDTVCSPI